MMKYIHIHNGDMQVMETSDLINAVKEAFVCFDSTDCVFSDHPQIRVFVKDGSIYDEPVSVRVCYSDCEDMIFCGDVIIGKLNTWSQGTLTNKEIQYLLTHLIPAGYNSFIAYE